MRILVIDDEEFVRLTLEETLRAEACEVAVASTAQAGFEHLRNSSFDCVVTDLRMPGTDGLGVLQWVREHQPDVDVLVMTGHAEVKAAVEAIKAGAWDFLVKDIPFDAAQVKAAVAKLRTVRKLRQENAALRFAAPAQPADQPVQGTSQAWHAMMETVRKVARSKAPVLIHGETGSGKEIVARTLHARSGRHDGPFLAVNCGAVSAEILESELFGYEKGAFTGATTSKIGLIAAAEGGTLFLDEIGEMSGPMQISLLRVLDRHEYRQVGGTRVLKANVRFVAATNRDLQELVLQGRFRDDLLYRINTIALRVPPLRERTGDIAALADYFLRTLHVAGTPVRSLTPEARACLETYRWPGNVRELRNVIERLILLSPTDAAGPISADEIAPLLSAQPSRFTPEGSTPSETLEDAERAHILRVLEHHHGNKTHTAKALQIDYKTLLTKLKSYGVAGEAH
jgi:two-component system response regulator AtoC